MAFENGSRAMNGTFGTVWTDGREIAEISAFQLKMAKNFDPINMCGQMAEDRKLVGVKITGSMTLHKVYSRGRTTQTPPPRATMCGGAWLPSWRTRTPTARSAWPSTA